MTINVTQADVEARLRRVLSEPEIEELPGVIVEATVLVEGYMQVVYSDTNPAPLPVLVVTSRVIARMYATPLGLPPQADSLTRGMGPFSATTHLVADTTSGGPWLTKSDKDALSPYWVGGVSAVPLTREGFVDDGDDLIDELNDDGDGS